MDKKKNSGELHVLSLLDPYMLLFPMPRNQSHPKNANHLLGLDSLIQLQLKQLLPYLPFDYYLYWKVLFSYQEQKNNQKLAKTT